MQLADKSTSAPKSRVNGHISDLFFNSDVDDANTHDKRGQWSGFDVPRLKGHAVDFLFALDCLGVPCLPSPDALVADFLERV